jgi:hypothetical protein
MISSWWTLGATVAGTVAVIISQQYIAKLARDQQVRIEQHRKDPTIPLVAPPSKFRLFVRNRGVIIVSVAVNIGFFFYWLSRPLPVGRGALFFMFLMAGNTVWILSSDALMRAQIRNTEIMGKSAEASLALSNGLRELDGKFQAMSNKLTDDTK